jgi:hypothetical protein
LALKPKRDAASGRSFLFPLSIGIKVLRPAQPNRAYDIVANKFRKNPAGEMKGWGLKIFP